MNSFSEDIEQMAPQVKNQYPNGFEMKHLKWGSYPLIALKLRIGEDEYLAYVRFENADKNGMMFIFGYLRKHEFSNGNKPSSRD